MKFKPTEALCNDYSASAFWDEQALVDETRRVFEICHGCRLCFNLCPSFNILFRAIDATEQEVSGVQTSSVSEVMEACYQCKLCYNKCPYTPAEKHEYQLDFPRLVLRYKAQQAKRRGIPWREKLLARPEVLGKLGGLFPWLANWANKTVPNRKLLQLALGIHPKKDLPRIATQTFQRWFRNRKPLERSSPRQKVVLFHTCFIEHNQPEIGHDTVYVLEKNGCEVICPKDQNCCGMPALDCGDIQLARERAIKNTKVLSPWVDQGLPVVAINPTCSLMLKEEFPRLLKGTDFETQGRKLAKATQDLGEFLYSLKQQGKFSEALGSLPKTQTVSYQAPCHLRAQNIGLRMRDLISAIPGIRVQPVLECSGHDGTWAMKSEYYELSKHAGKKCFAQIQAQNPDMVSTDCPLAALQIHQQTGRSTQHPIQLLAASYRSSKG